MRFPSKLPLITAVLVFLMAGYAVYSALTKDPIVMLPFALVPLLAGIGMLRGRVWSANGFALYLCGQILLLPMILLRNSGPTGKTSELIAAAVLVLLLIVLLLMAGRSLAASGGERGRALPWIVVTILLTVPMFFVQAFVIPTRGMEDTLQRGDRILVRVFPRPSPVRGDIIVFAYPADRRQSFVKRLVGIPGDRLRISQKVLYRNGTAVAEPYASHKASYMDPYRDNFPSQPDGPLFAAAAQVMLDKHVDNGEVVVPPGKYFVLGDSRDDSLDSRYWGFVDAGDLIGEPLLIYDSEEPPAEGAGGGARRIRWGRLFKLL